MKNPGVTLTVERLKQIEAGSGPSIQEAEIMARVCLFHHPDMFMDGFEGEPLDVEVKMEPMSMKERQATFFARCSLPLGRQNTTFRELPGA